MVGYASYLISIFMNIDENFKKCEIIVETFRGVPKQLPIPQLLTTLIVYHTWYQINAKTYEHYLIVRYANYLI